MMVDEIHRQKPTWNDIEKFIESQQIENDEIEFKQALSTKDGSIHPWYDGAVKLDSRARDEILSEVVGFANTYGGWLFLGISESASTPSHAIGICSVPRCALLAQKLHEMADACIEPRISGLKIWAVCPPSSEEGVIAIRSDRSASGPHRLLSNNAVFVRRLDRCVEASMQEIHQLVLSSQRRLVEALWTAQFDVGGITKNGGVIVLDSGRLFGGDSQFYYEGRYEVVKDQISADFRVHHYNGERVTAFGDSASSFSLTAEGTKDGDHIVAFARRSDKSHPPVQIILKRRQNLP